MLCNSFISCHRLESNPHPDLRYSAVALRLRQMASSPSVLVPAPPLPLPPLSPLPPLPPLVVSTFSPFGSQSPLKPASFSRPDTSTSVREIVRRDRSRSPRRRDRSPSLRHRSLPEVSDRVPIPREVTVPIRHLELIFSSQLVGFIIGKKAWRICGIGTNNLRKNSQTVGQNCESIAI